MHRGPRPKDHPREVHPKWAHNKPDVWAKMQVGAGWGAGMGGWVTEKVHFFLNQRSQGFGFLRFRVSEFLGFSILGFHGFWVCAC